MVQLHVARAPGLVCCPRKCAGHSHASAYPCLSHSCFFPISQFQMMQWERGRHRALLTCRILSLGPITVRAESRGAHTKDPAQHGTTPWCSCGRRCLRGLFHGSPTARWAGSAPAQQMACELALVTAVCPLLGTMGGTHSPSSMARGPWGWPMCWVFPALAATGPRPPPWQ